MLEWDIFFSAYLPHIQSTTPAAPHKSNQPDQMVWKIRIEGCVKCGRLEIEFSC